LAEGCDLALQAALEADQLTTELAANEVETLLTTQEHRWWRVKIQSFRSKSHFLLYAGRYVKRPPISQYRITSFDSRTVKFWYKDKKLHRRVHVQCSLEEFVKLWGQHIPERYQHGIRSFGLFAPRAISDTSALVFGLLGQKPRPRPKRRSWAESIKRDYGHDPLLDDSGQKMVWARRVPAPSTP